MQTLRTTVAQFTQASLTDLRSQIQGEVLTPGEAGYENARQAWNLALDQHPALIVVAHRPSDVVAAVRFAARAGLGIGVQSTGHGVVRPADGNLLIITSRMTGVQVNAENQTAWVEAGVKWGMVLAKTQEVGLAPLLGSSPDVGVVGYTLGGGMGWLARKYGLAADSVRYFELVTPDGQQLRVSATENSDLFWGLRGGGGNFGVITGMEIQLYPVATVYGGSLIYPVEHAKAVFTRYREWIASAPEELTSSIAILNFPPIPAVPEFLRGRSAVLVNGCYVGDPTEGEALVRPWLDWMAPMVSSFRAMPFSEVASISNDPVDPLPGTTTAEWLADLSDEVINTVIRYAVSVNGSSPITKTEIRHAGGAIARGSAQASAYGNRDSSLLLQMISTLHGPDARQIVDLHNADFKRDLLPHLTGGVYMNFMDGEEARARTKDAYAPESYQRLTQLKSKYDPDNRFRFGFNIAADTAE